ncbi:MAG: hypothetical protein GX623_01750 [Clostridiales bacterium]|nr:hypothetical protein [Clostridiales bacterium]
MFQELRFYKPCIGETVRRSMRSHEIALNRSREGFVTFRALPPTDVEYFGAFDLRRYDFETDLPRYARDLLTALERSMRLRREVEDNYIPNLSPMLGIADYSAFVAGDVTFARDTSWSTPVLKSLEDYLRLPPLGEAVWYGRFLDICRLMLQMSSGSGIPFLRGFFSPLDLAAALRGEAIYTDFYDEPELTRGFLDYCADCTIRFARDLYALCGEALGGTEYGMLFSDGINLSEDIACMISAPLYRDFCAPATQKVIDAFGKGYMHSHSRALYQVKEICALRGVATLWLATDPNQPRPFDHLRQLAQDANGVCLSIDCASFREMEERREELLGGNFSLTLPVANILEAVDATRRFERLFGGPS